MKTRLFAVLLVLVFLTISGLVVVTRAIDQVRATRTYHMTLTSIPLTNTAVSIRFSACESIANVIGDTYPCGMWLEYRTLTPTPTDASLPTPNSAQATATSIERTKYAAETLLPACSTVRGYTGNRTDPCPAILFTLTAKAVTLTPSVLDTPQN
jgi:hypothetical protein